MVALSVVLADGSALVANPISSTFGGAPPVTTAAPTHPQGAGTPTLVSSPRPSILRKKPANEGSVVGGTGGWGHSSGGGFVGSL